MLLRALTILLLALAACGPWQDEAEVELTLRPAPDTASAPAATVEAGQEVVRVHGVIAVPDRCQGLRADLTQNDADVRLWVMYERVRETCPPGARKLSYTADIQGLRSGRYTLRVVHGRSGMWRGTEPVLVHPIAVP